MALVAGFGAVTWLATAAHLIAITRGDAFRLADTLAEVRYPGPLTRYRRPDDPRIWIVTDHRVRRSPNARGTNPPATRMVNFATTPPMVVVRNTSGDRTVIVAWPLSGDLDVLRDLLAVLLVLGAVAAIVAVWLTSWATRRMLMPVDHMTRVVARMVQARRVAPLPAWSAADDEFTRLTTVFNELLQQLEQQAERERQMLAQAAHELRTPLQVLSGNLDLLSRWGGLDPDVRRDSLEQSRQVLNRLSRLIQDLLMLERAQSGSERTETVDLDVMLETLLDDMRALAPERPIRARLEPVAVLASPWRMERAIWVAVDNALHYTPPESPIDLTIIREGQLAGVEVRDHGPGIPADELPRVFERFFRGAASRGREGTGLGLPIARALVEHDGGTITLTAEVGRGTTVRLLWPRRV
jgi:signal transduction histidine kinase